MMTRLLHALRGKHPGNVKDKIDTACLAQAVVQQGSRREKGKAKRVVNILVLISWVNMTLVLFKTLPRESFLGQRLSVHKNLSRKTGPMSLDFRMVQMSPEVTPDTSIDFISEAIGSPL